MKSFMEGVSSVSDLFRTQTRKAEKQLFIAAVTLMLRLTLHGRPTTLSVTRNG